MNPAPFEIYLAEAPWENCEDARPWLVVRVLANGVSLCFPISGQCYTGSCFEIGEQDFRRCGQTKPSFIHDRRYYPLELGQFIKYMGKLEGDLLRRFLEYSGIEEQP